MIVWKLYELMARKRLTGKQVAEKINSHPNTVYRLRRPDGTMPAIDGELLNKLCKALDCTPNDLIKYIPDTDETAKPSSTSSALSSADTAAAIEAVVGTVTQEIAGTIGAADIAVVASVATKAALSALQAVKEKDKTENT